MRKLLTFLFAALMSVGMYATTVTWNNDDITSTDQYGGSFTKDGVTITAVSIDFNNKNFIGGGTFTTTLGNFTKIEVSGDHCDVSGTGWTGDNTKQTWTGNASSVSFDGVFMGNGMGTIQFVFTIEVPPVAQGTCGDNLTWKYYSDKSLVIEGSGEMTDFGPNGAPWYSIKEEIATVSLPDGLTHIGSYAFDDCYKKQFTSITIPSSVESIGERTFDDCSFLASVTMQSTTPPTLGTDAFKNCADGLTITVPSCEGVENAYKAATNWSNYSSKISGTGECSASTTIRSGMTAGNYYTVCYNKAMSEISGATFYSIGGKDATSIYLVEETASEIEKGKPYIIQASATELTAVVGDATETAGTNGAIHGTFAAMDQTAIDAAATTVGNAVYLLHNNQICQASGQTGNSLPANCAYIVLAEVSDGAPSNVPANRVRRLPLQENTATGVENVERGETSVQKVLRNGQLFIIDGDKMYNAQGMLVR